MDRLPNGRGDSIYSQSRSVSMATRSDSTMTFRRFSPSRRMFCLLTLFDFLFTLIAWVIYAHVSKISYVQCLSLV
jgi:hypothetical protein